MTNLIGANSSRTAAKLFVAAGLAMLGLMICPTISVAAELRQYDIRVDGMTCPFCVATSEKALKKITGVHAVTTNLEQGEISVCADDRAVFTEAELKKLFLAKGFTFRSFTQSQKCSVADD